MTAIGLNRVPFPVKLLPSAALGLFLITMLVVACGGQEPIAGPTATASPSTTAIVVAPTVPLATATPEPTAIPRPTATSVPSPTPKPTASPTAFVAPPSTTATKAPTPTPGPTPIPQTAELKLEVTFPPGDQTVSAETLTVAGLTSPDATVSVNGNLVTPDINGLFSFDLAITPAENPLVIEVIATSVAGEERSVIRTVIFVP